MTRRGLLLTSLIATRVSDVRDKKKFLRGTRVILNGEDISHNCYRAEERLGIVKAYCYKRNSEGQFYFDPTTNTVAEEVTISFGEIIFPEKELTKEEWNIERYNSSESRWAKYVEVTNKKLAQAEA